MSIDIGGARLYNALLEDAHFMDGTCFNEDCKAPNAEMTCSGCQVATYCGRKCQKVDWSKHKELCTSLLNKVTYKNIGEFSDNDLKTLDFSRSAIKHMNVACRAKTGSDEVYLSKEGINCFEYALLLIGERGFREQFFTPVGKTSSGKTILEGRLKKWSFEVVQEPREGDLVLYYNKDDGRSHLGVYFKKGRVKSKCGTGSPLEITHQVNDAGICKLYGDKITYYRKNLEKKAKYDESSVLKIK